MGWAQRLKRVFSIDVDRCGRCGGGFGNTVQLADGTFVTAYSYRGSDTHTHTEIVRWRLPSLEKFPVNNLNVGVTVAPRGGNAVA